MNHNYPDNFLLRLEMERGYDNCKFVKFVILIGLRISNLISSWSWRLINIFHHPSPFRKFNLYLRKRVLQVLFLCIIETNIYKRLETNFKVSKDFVLHQKQKILYKKKGVRRKYTCQFLLFHNPSFGKLTISSLLFNLIFRNSPLKILKFHLSISIKLTMHFPKKKVTILRQLRGKPRPDKNQVHKISTHFLLPLFSDLITIRTRFSMFKYFKSILSHFI